MDLEKLYQDVWAQVFAMTWLKCWGQQDEAATDLAKSAANAAAERALKSWDPAKAHAAICAAQGLPTPEGE